VTTISRAVVLLGFNALKQICITAKLVDSLLKSHDISQPVYERLLRLIAQSFHAAMLARMILADYDEATREEAYIAALLHNLGESAFWSMGGPITEQLDQKLRQTQGDSNEINPRNARHQLYEDQCRFSQFVEYGQHVTTVAQRSGAAHARVTSDCGSQYFQCVIT
jgi:Predicted signal transduction protein